VWQPSVAVGSPAVLHRLRFGVKRLLPVALHSAAKRAMLAATAVALRGDSVECPCCGRTFRRFLAYPGLFCPGCSSYERHRFMWLVFERRPELLAGREGVLHVGPEPCVVRILERAGVAGYLSIDLIPGRAMRAMNLTNLDLPDDSFDLALCSHVLDEAENRDDDRLRALTELRRVVRPGGLALFGTMVPLQERLEARLARAGFDVEILVAGELGPDAVRRYGLLADERLYLATA